jgi:hypothetical protein
MGKGEGDGQVEPVKLSILTGRNALQRGLRLLDLWRRTARHRCRRGLHNHMRSSPKLSQFDLGDLRLYSWAFESCTALAGVYFRGNAPSADFTVFAGDGKATVYYLPGLQPLGGQACARFRVCGKAVDGLVQVRDGSCPRLSADSGLTPARCRVKSGKWVQKMSAGGNECSLGNAGSINGRRGKKQMHIS